MDAAEIVRIMVCDPLRLQASGSQFRAKSVSEQAAISPWEPRFRRAERASTGKPLPAQERLPGRPVRRLRTERRQQRHGLVRRARTGEGCMARVAIWVVAVALTACSHRAVREEEQVAQMTEFRLSR